MKRTHVNSVCAVMSIVALTAVTLPPLRANSSRAVLELKKGDHICLVGNSLGERLQHYIDWESRLYTRFPDLDLVVRNLCFAADEPLVRPRSANFGDPDDHLKHSAADVILFFFGFNESFRGPEGLDAFRADLTKLVAETKAKDYSGRGSPRIVLVSPIAHENLHNPDLPDGNATNADIERYKQAIAAIAEKTGVGFVDVFTPTRELFADPKTSFTINGVHLSKRGYAKFGEILDTALFGPAGTPTKPSAKLIEQIADKNFHWWQRYRAIDGYYIYGGRSKLRFQPDTTISNNDVCERERAILDQMTANRDRRIWAVANGRDVAAKVDDSNTLPFIEVETNYGGKQEGKEGSLEYLHPDEQVKKFKLGAGYAVNCFASEKDFPELQNPVQFTFDSRGRLWVTCMPSYPHWKPKTVLDDKVLILEDTDGDGRADKSTIFARGLHCPTGIELGDGGAYVPNMPYIMHYRDTDGDDVADEQTMTLGGFDSADSHHQASVFVWGPGGALYFQEGTFFRTQVETPYGPMRCFNAGVFRFEPRTAKLDAFISYNFANPWGHIFDRWGQNFVADASGGANYYGTAFSGHVDHPRKHPGMKQFINKRFRPTSGCEFVSSRHFPPEAQGNFLLNNTIGALGVYQHEMSDEGSGFIGKEIEPILECDDRNFRPVDLQFGPDGALYVCDWHNALIGHMQHSIRDPHRDKAHGRIWRVTYPARPLVTPPNIAGASIEHLLDLLKAPEDRTRYRVRRELRERDTKRVVAALQTWVDKLDRSDADYEHHKLEALWVYQHHNVVNQALLKDRLASPDHRARAAATRVLCYWRDRVDDTLEWLRKQVNDDHPRVRLEAVRACSFMGTAKAAEIALEATQYELDEYLEYTLKETLETLSHYD